MHQHSPPRFASARHSHAKSCTTQRTPVLDSRLAEQLQLYPEHLNDPPPPPPPPPPPRPLLLVMKRWMECPVTPHTEASFADNSMLLWKNKSIPCLPAPSFGKMSTLEHHYRSMFNHVFTACGASCCVGVGCQDVQAQEVEVPDS